MMQRLKQFWRSFFLAPRLFWSLGLLIALFAFAHFLPELFPLAVAASYSLSLLLVADSVLLWRKDGLTARRETAERFSNGDENPVHIHLRSSHGMRVRLKILDEIPDIFQRRDLQFHTAVDAFGEKTFTYHLRPVKRGTYAFGGLNIFLSSPIALLRRRYVFDADVEIPVYPSYMQMRELEMKAFSHRLQDYGFKKQRRTGSHTEFEQIREYSLGDDFRKVNWKATARKSRIMVNEYQEEKAQQIYCILDKGRMMRSPFNGLSLLDYAINASLALSNVVLKKSDKAGVITLSEDRVQFLPADRRSRQMMAIHELLHKQKTRYLEPDYELLYGYIRKKVSNRSLLVLFTNYESLVSLKRNLKYLRSMAAHHLVMVVFFRNTELDLLQVSRAQTPEEVYMQTVADQFAYEKELIVHELRRFGIYSVLSRPEDLSLNTINQYLDLKARALI